MTVHILATCRNDELLDNTLLVFDTIRVGFPTADVFVYGNSLFEGAEMLVMLACQQGGFRYERLSLRSHGQWIEALLDTQDDPFWICDTDIMFHGPVEHWFEANNQACWAGRFEPEYRDPVTKAIHMARLHPSLMWFNTGALRAAIRGWPGLHEFFHSVERTLIRWSFIPFRGEIIFLDTMAGLFGAMPKRGRPFTTDQNGAFSHLYCGTYLDVACIDGLAETHAAMKAGSINPAELLAAQYRWFAEHRES